MADLDHLLHRAREATVRHEVAEGYVRELDRWHQRTSPRRWRGWLAAGMLAATAAILVLVLRPAGVADVPGPVRIGDHTAIVAERGTRYRVVRATADETTIAVDHGAVTARLWPGTDHRLTLEGGGVTATATGTVYQLRVDPRGSKVHVDEGTVRVETEDRSESVTAGASWPPGTARPARRAAQALLAMPAPPPPRPQLVEARVADAATSPTSDDDTAPAAVAPSPDPKTAGVPAAAILSIKDRWRRARLLRSQGAFQRAIDDCLAIAATRNSTWAPIAIVEAIRIYDGPLADPDQAILLAERFLREWSASALAPEVRQLRCHALEQLGRTCDAPPGD